MTKETKMKPANHETRQAMEDVLASFSAFKDANDERLSEIEAKASGDVLLEEKVSRIDSALTQQKSALDRLLLDQSRPGLQAEAVDDARTGWSRFMRSGDASHMVEGKSASAGVLSDGGYVVPQQTEAFIDRLLTAASPIRAIASVRQTHASVFRKPISRGGAASGWVTETAARPETDSPTLDLLDFPTAELYAMPAATTQLLDDAMVDIDQWLAEEVQDVFAEQESAAFVSGDGINKPKGFLSYGRAAEGSQGTDELGYVATGASGGFAASDPADALINLVYAPKNVFRARGRFVMNKSTLSAVRRFKDADGHYLWQPNLSEGGSSTLLGYGITEAEDMPNIEADSAAIAFGDFSKGYLILDRQGVQVLRDPYSAKPYVLFYTTKRVGGGVQNFDAIKVLKFGAS
jgi:HK97 family phage major capsid protein